MLYFTVEFWKALSGVRTSTLIHLRGNAHQYCQALPVFAGIVGTKVDCSQGQLFQYGPHRQIAEFDIISAACTSLGFKRHKFPMHHIQDSENEAGATLSKSFVAFQQKSAIARPFMLNSLSLSSRRWGPRSRYPSEILTVVRPPGMIFHSCVMR